MVMHLDVTAPVSKKFDNKTSMAITLFKFEIKKKISYSLCISIPGMSYRWIATTSPVDGGKANNIIHR